MIFQLKKIFFTKRFIFGKIKNCQVLILDNGFSNLNLKEICNSITVENQIFLTNVFFAVIKYFFKFDFISESFADSYLREIISSSKAKIIIDHDMNGKGFRAKKYFPSKKVIIYQFCDHPIRFKDVLKKAIIANHNLDELKCDYYLCKSKNYEKMLEFVKGKFIEVGSVKNNEIQLSRNEKKEYDIMFVSIFRAVDTFYGRYSVNSMMPQEANAAFIMKILSKYCSHQNKKITVALSSNRKDKQQKHKYIIQHHKKIEHLTHLVDKVIDDQDEKKFFSNFAKNIIFEKIDSYHLASKSKLIVTTGSTLGLELLSRGMKVLFLDSFPQFYDSGPPAPICNYTQEMEGPFWYCGTNKDAIIEKIEKLSKMSNEEWTNTINQSLVKIKYDDNNLILKKLVKTTLSDLNH